MRQHRYLASGTDIDTDIDIDAGTNADACTYKGGDAERGTAGGGDADTGTDTDTDSNIYSAFDVWHSHGALPFTASSYTRRSPPCALLPLPSSPPPPPRLRRAPALGSISVPVSAFRSGDRAFPLLAIPPGLSSQRLRPSPSPLPRHRTRLTAQRGLASAFPRPQQARPPDAPRSEHPPMARRGSRSQSIPTEISLSIFQNALLPAAR
jgi:hypothetical protein